MPWHARPGLPWRHWGGHPSPPLHGPLLHSKSQLHALRSARIHTISSQTRNRYSCGLLISQSLKPRGSGITGPGLGAHPFAKDKTAENTISMSVHKERKCSQHPQKSQRTLPFEHQSLISSHPSDLNTASSTAQKQSHFSESDGSPFDFYRKRKVLRTETIISTLTSWGREHSRG